MLNWGLGPIPEEEFSTEALADLGAILMMGSHCFEGLFVALRLEVCFTICLRLSTTALSSSPLSIQSGFRPKP